MTVPFPLATAEVVRSRALNRHFWATQLLVLLLAGGHTALEAAHLLPQEGVFYFVPEVMFLVPVVHAGLAFGMHGAVATALWSTVLSMPNAWLWHRGAELGGVLFQLLIVNVVAYFIGLKVDHENGARRQVEIARAALQVSEERYRNLFEAAAEGVLVLDAGGKVLEANLAAHRLFDHPLDGIKDRPLADLVGQEGASRIVSRALAARSEPVGQELTLHRQDGSEVPLEAKCTSFTSAAGQTVLQVSLRDVTLYRHRQQELRSYAARIVEAQEDERLRIAQELHDETVQGLILLCRRLDAVEEGLGRQGGDVLQGIETARLATEELVEGLRKITWNLRPPALDNLGVVASIRRLLDDLGRRTGIRWDIKVEGTARRLPPDIELGVFRIAQEAIHNAEKHARATTVQAAVAFLPGLVRFSVQDDGTGFSPDRQAANPADRLGLVGMRERAIHLGGTLVVNSAPGGGTTLWATIPTPDTGD